MENILNFFINPKVYLPFIYILGGMISHFILKHIIGRILKNKSIKNRGDNNRFKTVFVMLSNVIKIIIFIIVLIMILSLYGINVKSLLTGLGIVGAVLGLAFQDILKDIISGVAIVLENYFSIGDVIEINGFKGTVVDIGIRSIRIKDWRGKLLIINNRNISEIINCSSYNSLAVVEISISNKENGDKVLKILKDCFKNKNVPNVINVVDVVGFVENGEETQTVRIMAETKPEEHYQVERDMRNEAYKALNKENIKFKRIEVVTL